MIHVDSAADASPEGVDRHCNGAADVHRNMVPFPAHLYRLAQAGTHAGAL